MFGHFRIRLPSCTHKNHQKSTSRGCEINQACHVWGYGSDSDEWVDLRQPAWEKGSISAATFATVQTCSNHWKLGIQVDYTVRMVVNHQFLTLSSGTPVSRFRSNSYVEGLDTCNKSITWTWNKVVRETSATRLAAFFCWNMLEQKFFRVWTPLNVNQLWPNAGGKNRRVQGAYGQLGTSAFVHQDTNDTARWPSLANGPWSDTIGISSMWTNVDPPNLNGEMYLDWKWLTILLLPTSRAVATVSWSWPRVLWCSMLSFAYTIKHNRTCCWHDFISCANDSVRARVMILQGYYRYCCVGKSNGRRIFP